MKLKVTQNHEKLKKKSFLNVPLQLSVEILMRGIGVGSPEKLAAAHLDNYRMPDTLKKAGLGAIADDLPLKTRLARFRRGAYPDSITPCN
jgi:hypothetical protein